MTITAMSYSSSASLTRIDRKLTLGENPIPPFARDARIGVVTAVLPRYPPSFTCFARMFRLFSDFLARLLPRPPLLVSSPIRWRVSDISWHFPACVPPSPLLHDLAPSRQPILTQSSEQAFVELLMERFPRLATLVCQRLASFLCSFIFLSRSGALSPDSAARFLGPNFSRSKGFPTNYSADFAGEKKRVSSRNDFDNSAKVEIYGDDSRIWYRRFHDFLFLVYNPATDL